MLEEYQFDAKFSGRTKQSIEISEYFVPKKQKAQVFKFEDYAQMAQIFKDEPLSALIRKLFHTKTVGFKKMA